MVDRERVFFGFSLQAEAAAVVANRQAQLNRLDLGMRMVPEENLHLTLRFVGGAEPVDRERLLAGVDELALPSSFEIRLTGWGAFPRDSSAKVIWIGVDDKSGKLQTLNQVTEYAALQAGFPPERRPYRPHLTVARSQSPRDVRSALIAADPIDLSVTVTRCTLFRSVAGSGHPRYEPICSFLLSGHESLHSGS